VLIDSLLYEVNLQGSAARSAGGRDEEQQLSA